MTQRLYNLSRRATAAALIAALVVPPPAFAMRQLERRESPAGLEELARTLRGPAAPPMSGPAAGLEEAATEAQPVHLHHLHRLLAAPTPGLRMAAFLRGITGPEDSPDRFLHSLVWFPGHPVIRDVALHVFTRQEHPTSALKQVRQQLFKILTGDDPGALLLMLESVFEQLAPEDVEPVQRGMDWLFEAPRAESHREQLALTLSAMLRNARANGTLHTVHVQLQQELRQAATHMIYDRWVEFAAQAAGHARAMAEGYGEMAARYVAASDRGASETLRWMAVPEMQLHELSSRLEEEFQAEQRFWQEGIRASRPADDPLKVYQPHYVGDQVGLDDHRLHQQARKEFDAVIGQAQASSNHEVVFWILHQQRAWEQAYAEYLRVRLEWHQAARSALDAEWHALDRPFAQRQTPDYAARQSALRSAIKQLQDGIATLALAVQGVERHRRDVTEATIRDMCEYRWRAWGFDGLMANLATLRGLNGAATLMVDPRTGRILSSAGAGDGQRVLLRPHERQFFLDPSYLSPAALHPTFQYALAWHNNTVSAAAGLEEPLNQTEQDLVFSWAYDFLQTADVMPKLRAKIGETLQWLQYFTGQGHEPRLEPRPATQEEAVQQFAAATTELARMLATFLSKLNGPPIPPNVSAETWAALRYTARTELLQPLTTLRQAVEGPLTPAAVAQWTAAYNHFNRVAEAMGGLDSPRVTARSVMPGRPRTWQLVLPPAASAVAAAPAAGLEEGPLQRFVPLPKTRSPTGAERREWLESMRLAAITLAASLLHNDVKRWEIAATMARTTRRSRIAPHVRRLVGWRSNSATPVVKAAAWCLPELLAVLSEAVDHGQEILTPEALFSQITTPRFARRLRGHADRAKAYRELALDDADKTRAVRDMITRTLHAARLVPGRQAAPQSGLEEPPVLAVSDLQAAQRMLADRSQPALTVLREDVAHLSGLLTGRPALANQSAWTDTVAKTTHVDLEQLAQVLDAWKSTLSSPILEQAWPSVEQATRTLRDAARALGDSHLLAPEDSDTRRLVTALDDALRAFEVVATAPPPSPAARPWLLGAGRRGGIGDFPRALRPQLRAAQTFTARVRVLARACGESDQGVSRTAGREGSLLSSWWRRETETPEPATIRAVSDFLNVDARYLVTGRPVRSAFLDGTAGARGRRQRLTRGQTQAALAQQMGISEEAVKHFENSRRRLDRPNLARFGSGLGLPAVVLETGFWPSQDAYPTVDGARDQGTPGFKVLSQQERRLARHLEQALLEVWQRQGKPVAVWEPQIIQDPETGYQGLAGRLVAASPAMLAQAAYYHLLPQEVADWLQRIPRPLAGQRWTAGYAQLHDEWLRVGAQAGHVRTLAGALARAHRGLEVLSEVERASYPDEPFLRPDLGRPHRGVGRYANAWDLVARLMNRARVLALLDQTPNSLDRDVFVEAVLLGAKNPEATLVRKERLVQMFRTRHRALSEALIRHVVWWQRREGQVALILGDAARLLPAVQRGWVLEVGHQVGRPELAREFVRRLTASPGLLRRGVEALSRREHIVQAAAASSPRATQLRSFAQALAPALNPRPEDETADPATWAAYDLLHRLVAKIHARQASFLANPAADRGDLDSLVTHVVDQLHRAPVTSRPAAPNQVEPFLDAIAESYVTPAGIEERNNHATAAGPALPDPRILEVSDVTMRMLKTATGVGWQNIPVVFADTLVGDERGNERLGDYVRQTGPGDNDREKTTLYDKRVREFAQHVASGGYLRLILESRTIRLEKPSADEVALVLTAARVMAAAAAGATFETPGTPNAAGLEEPVPQAGPRAEPLTVELVRSAAGELAGRVAAPLGVLDAFTRQLRQEAVALRLAVDDPSRFAEAHHQIQVLAPIVKTQAEAVAAALRAASPRITSPVLKATLAHECGQPLVGLTTVPGSSVMTQPWAPGGSDTERQRVAGDMETAATRLRQDTQRLIAVLWELQHLSRLERTSDGASLTLAAGSGPLTLPGRVEIQNRLRDWETRTVLGDQMPNRTPTVTVLDASAVTHGFVRWLLQAPEVPSGLLREIVVWMDPAQSSLAAALRARKITVVTTAHETAEALRPLRATRVHVYADASKVAELTSALRAAQLSLSVSMDPHVGEPPNLVDLMETLFVSRLLGGAANAALQAEATWLGVALGRLAILSTLDGLLARVHYPWVAVTPALWAVRVVVDVEGMPAQVSANRSDGFLIRLARGGSLTAPEAPAAFQNALAAYNQGIAREPLRAAVANVVSVVMPHIDVIREAMQESLPQEPTRIPQAMAVVLREIETIRAESRTVLADTHGMVRHTLLHEINNAVTPIQASAMLYAEDAETVRAGLVLGSHDQAQAVARIASINGAAARLESVLVMLQRAPRTVVKMVGQAPILDVDQAWTEEFVEASTTIGQALQALRAPGAPTDALLAAIVTRFDMLSRLLDVSLPHQTRWPLRARRHALVNAVNAFQLAGMMAGWPPDRFERSRGYLEEGLLRLRAILWELGQVNGDIGRPAPAPSPVHITADSPMAPLTAEQAQFLWGQFQGFSGREPAAGVPTPAVTMLGPSIGEALAKTLIADGQESRRATWRLLLSRCEVLAPDLSASWVRILPAFGVTVRATVPAANTPGAPRRLVLGPTDARPVNPGIPMEILPTVEPLLIFHELFRTVAEDRHPTTSLTVAEQAENAWFASALARYYQ